MATAELSSAISPRPPPLAFERVADQTIVWLRGEHDLSTVAALSATMAQAMGLDDGDLCVDLSEVEFMGAETVGILVGAHGFLRGRSRSLSLRSPSTCAQRVVDLCDLDDLLGRGRP